MAHIETVEADSALAPLLDRIEHGNHLLITRGGKLVARLIPDAEFVGRAEAEAAAERIRARSAQIKTPFDWEALKKDRDDTGLDLPG